MRETSTPPTRRAALPSIGVLITHAEGGRELSAEQWTILSNEAARKTEAAPIKCDGRESAGRLTDSYIESAGRPTDS